MLVPEKAGSGYKETTMADKKRIEERIRETAQEFRDPEIEYQLMAYLVRSNSNSCGMMKREWMSDILLQDIFIVVSDLKIVMSKAMLMHELSDRNMIGKDEEGLYTEVVDQLFDMDISGFNNKNTQHMMNQVLRLSESRKVLTGCGEVIGQMRKFDLENAKQKLAVLGRPVGLVNRENSGFYLDDYGERQEIMEEKVRNAEEHEDSQVGIPTGIVRFDRMVGGLMPKEFGVIAGVTGVGKTAALIGIAAYSWLRGFDVMVVSGEMSKELLGFRIDSYLTRISGMKFRTADLTSSDYKKWDATIKLYKAKQDNFLYVATYPRRFTTDNLEQDLTRLQEETGRKAKVICMDYINIMDPIQHGKSQGNWKDQSDAVWDFKGFVSEHNMVGWTAGQVIDDAYGKELYEASDLKYARAISECAPVIAALIRTEKDIVENRMKLQVIKMRNAELPRKPIAMTPRLNIMRIHEEMHEMKTLKGRQANTVDVKKETKKARPRRTLKGKQ